MQLNQNRDISIPKQLTVGQNAYITTLQVNQNTYLNGSVLLHCVDINTLYQTRAWVSLKVSYNAQSQTPTTVYQYGRATATVSTANSNTSWFITFPAHPAGDNYVSQYYSRAIWFNLPRVSECYVYSYIHERNNCRR